jgi:cytochrome c6
MKKKLGIALIAIMAASTMSAFAQNAGADTYKSKCQMCHGADGTGDTPAGKSMKSPSLSAPAIVKESNDDLIAVTKAGKGKMPGYAGKLTDAQIKDVVLYIRTLEKK